LSFRIFERSGIRPDRDRWFLSKNVCITLTKNK
jgi:hypothetical protein